jgi:hypothetical protein
MNSKNNTIPDDDTNLEEFYKRLRSHKYDDSSCFLCAKSFEDVEPTSEHIFPKWLQNKYNLCDQRLIILNQSSVPYRQLTVPCCVECNSYYLQSIEKTISDSLNHGYKSFQNLETKKLFLWLRKIFYGILFKELFLLLNRKNENGLTITTPEILKEYETHLLLLQEVRKKIEFTGDNSGSIYIFQTQKPSEIKLQWDMFDNIDTSFIALRMGEVGIIGCLADGGAHMIYKDDYEAIMKLPLHPIQFKEICAHFSYRSTLTTRIPKFITIESNPHKIIQTPLGGFSLKPYFDEWDVKTYAQYLSFYTGLSLDKLYTPPDKVMTWLYNPSGKLQFMNFEDFPFI